MTALKMNCGYQKWNEVTTNKRSGIVNDPNRADDPEYIINLLQRVITISVETVKLVKGLPELLETIEH
jgi:predicted helicase